MNVPKSASRWPAVSALATVGLCLLTALGAPRPATGWDATAKGGGTAALRASVNRPETLHMAGLDLSQMDSASEPVIDQSLGEPGKNIVHVTSRLQTRTEEVPYTTRYIGVEQAGTQPYVVSPGQAGEKVVTYRLTLHDGVEVAREVVGEEITVQPVEEVVCRGAGGELVIDGETYNSSRGINMRATAYTTENKSWKRTASGTTARVGAVAVDRDVIPLGTKLYIVAADGTWCYGIATAEDTGVKGNKVDIFLNTYNECIYFGVRDAVVYVLED